MKGIDISHYQSGLDIRRIRDAGFDFAILKLTEGEGGADASAPAFYMRAREAGIPTGGYCYSRALTPEEAKREARFLLGELRGFPMPLGLYLDAEEPGQLALPADRLRDTVLAFCGEVRAAGYTPGVYGSEYGLWARLAPDELPGDTLVWIAHYGKEPALPCDLWQRTDCGAVAGYAGPVDVDEVRSARFRALVEGGRPAQPDPAVLVLQLLLRDRGLWRGGADGFKSPALAGALRRLAEEMEGG